MFAEYGNPLAGIAWAIGHWVWLRVGTGPQLVQVVGFDHRVVEILPSDHDAMAMRVPAERLAWSYREAVSA